MSAVAIEEPKGDLTVGGLMAYLQAMQDAWTAEDTMYLGTFECQRINVPYFDKEGKFKGYGPGRITYNGGLDFIVDEPKEKDHD